MSWLLTADRGSRIRRVASRPSSSGIWTSIRTRSYGRASRAWIASTPFAATSARNPNLPSNPIATCWFVALSSARRIFIAASSAGSRSSTTRFDRTGSSGPFSFAPAITTARQSNRSDCRTGLPRYADRPSSSMCAGSARVPSEVIRTSLVVARLRSALMTRASSSPSIPGIAISRIAAPNGSPCSRAARSIGNA